MKPLIETLCIVVGCYFAAYSGRLLVLRSAGHTPLFKALDTVTGYLPYLSIAILLITGIAVVLRNAVSQPRILASKLLLVLIIAVIPFAIHMAMYNLTYSAGPQPQRPLWGTLSASEWGILLFGGLLIGIGIFLLLSSWHESSSQP